MGIRLDCGHCERGRVMWAGDEYQCIQCGWIAPETMVREQRARGLTAAVRSRERGDGSGPRRLPRRDTAVAA